MEKINTEKVYEAHELIARGVNFSAANDEEKIFWGMLSDVLTARAANRHPRGNTIWSIYDPDNMKKGAEVLASAINFNYDSKGPEYWDSVMIKLREERPVQTVSQPIEDVEEEQIYFDDYPSDEIPF